MTLTEAIPTIPQSQPSFPAQYHFIPCLFWIELSATLFCKCLNMAFGCLHHTPGTPVVRVQGQGFCHVFQHLGIDPDKRPVIYSYWSTINDATTLRGRDARCGVCALEAGFVGGLSPALARRLGSSCVTRTTGCVPRRIQTPPSSQPHNTKFFGHGLGSV